MSPPDQDVSSVRQRMQRIPGPVLDVGLVLMAAVAILALLSAFRAPDSICGFAFHDRPRRPTTPG